MAQWPSEPVDEGQADAAEGFSAAGAAAAQLLEAPPSQGERTSLVTFGPQLQVTCKPSLAAVLLVPKRHGGLARMRSVSKASLDTPW